MESIQGGSKSGKIGSNGTANFIHLESELKTIGGQEGGRYFFLFGLMFTELLFLPRI